MTMQSPSPGTPLIPENAPFSAEQRAWLNGFFAGVLSLDAGAKTGDSRRYRRSRREHSGGRWRRRRGTLARSRHRDRRAHDAGPGPSPAPSHDGSDGAAGLRPMRLQLRGLRQRDHRAGRAAPQSVRSRRQGDGAHAEVARRGNGRRRARSGREGRQGQRKARESLDDVRPGRSREAPVAATFRFAPAPQRRRAPRRSTNHIEIDLTECGLDYEPSATASASCRPTVPKLVDAILTAIAAPADFPIGDKTLRDALIEDTSLVSGAGFPVPAHLLSHRRRRANVRRRHFPRAQDPDGDAATLDVLAALEKFPGIHPDPEAFYEVLEPLQPRLYSISSSMKANPGRVSLTVDTVRYDLNARERLGVCSTLSRRSHRAGSHAQGLCAEGPRLRAAEGWRHARSSWSDPAPALRRSVPSCRSAMPPRLRPRVAVLRPSAARNRFLLRGRARRAAGSRHVDEALARLVARRRQEDLRPGPHARGRPPSCSRGSRKARTSTSAAMPSAWRRMSRQALVDAVAEHGKVSSDDAKAYVAALKKVGRYQADVY